MTDNFKILESIKINSSDWDFSDLRIDIPPMSSGSDAANPHTQYSNALATYTYQGTTGIGGCFTLGEGNQYVCSAAEYIVRNLEGVNLRDLLHAKSGLAEVLANPIQLRWISPNAGLPLMAAGLVLNTIIDLVSKKAEMPAWKYLASLEIEEFLKLVGLRHIKDSAKIGKFFMDNSPKLSRMNQRFEELEAMGVPSYFTTWIGSNANALVKEIGAVNEKTGIDKFKIKVGINFETETEKIDQIVRELPSDFKFAADANQNLDLEDAEKWMKFLSDKGFMWLEEPFAPDNLLLFRELVSKRESHTWSCEIATGENCANLQMAQALLDIGINRFQADPCRMMGITDGLFSGVLTKFYEAEYSPHAGGAGLDEMSRHLQFFFLSKIDPGKKIENSLTEYIGFCSKFYSNPAKVENGRIFPPDVPGLLVGLAPEVAARLLPYKEGVSWLKP
jgi:L-fuconate dehydratase